METTVNDVITSTAMLLNTTVSSVTHTHESLRAVEIFAAALMCLLIVMAFQGNLWIVIVILINPQLRSSMANILIINLCVVDLVASVVAMPLAVVSFVEGDNGLGKNLCEVSGFFTTCVMVASLLSLGVISIERFYTIALPMHHAGHATPCLYLIVVTLIWLISLLVGVLPWIGVNSYSFRPSKRTCSFYWQGGSSHDRSFIIVIVVVSFLVPSVILVTMYIGIYRVARKAATTVAPQPSGVRIPASGAECELSAGSVTTEYPNKNRDTVFTVTGVHHSRNGRFMMPSLEMPQINVVSPTVSGNFDTRTHNERPASREDSGFRTSGPSDSASNQSCPPNDCTVYQSRGSGEQEEVKEYRGFRTSPQNGKKETSFLTKCVCSEVDTLNKTKISVSTTSTVVANPDDHSSPEASKTAPQNNGSTLPLSNPPKSLQEPEPSGQSSGKITSSHMKAFKTLMIIVVSYFILWCPYFACLLHGITHEEAASVHVELLVTWLGFTSYAVNPCLYGCMNRTIRDELSQIKESCSSRWCCYFFYCITCRPIQGTQTQGCLNICPCPKDYNKDEAEADPEEEGDDASCGAAESFYQFLQRTQASEDSSQGTDDKHKGSKVDGACAVNVEMNNMEEGDEHQNDCVF